jgi:hypothetical protein
VPVRKLLIFNDSIAAMKQQKCMTRQLCRKKGMSSFNLSQIVHFDKMAGGHEGGKSLVAAPLWAERYQCSRKLFIECRTLSEKLKPCISKVLLPLCLPVLPLNEKCGIIKEIFEVQIPVTEAGICRI